MYEIRQPGWYQDPYGTSDLLRYWDGEQWTQMTQGQNHQPRNSSVDKVGKTVKSAAGGALSIIFGLVGLVLNIAFGAMVIIAICTFVFGMGGWKLAGVRFSDWLWIALHVITVLTLINYGLVKPIWTIYLNSKFKGILRESFADDDLDRQDKQDLDFAIRYLNTTHGAVIASMLAAAVIALFTHDLLMTAMGNPWAEITTMAIMVIGTRILVILIGTPFHVRLSKEDPDAKAMWDDAMAHTGRRY